MRGGGVKNSAGREAGEFFKIAVLPAWELYFGVINMARHLQTPFLGGSTVTLDSLLGGPWITFGAL